MNPDWAELYRTTSLPRAHLIQSYLEENGIKAVILNQQDSSYISFGDILIYVAKTNLIKANWLLEKF